MHYVQLFLKDYVDALAHPCISLLKCLCISHPFFYLPLLALVAKHFIRWKLFCLLYHLHSLAWACVRIHLGGSEDSMLCTLYWNTNPIYARTLGSSLMIFRTLFGSFWLLAYFVELSSHLIFFCNLWILYIVWSPSIYSSLDMCIWFHSYYEKCTHYGGALTIFAF